MRYWIEKISDLLIVLRYGRNIYIVGWPAGAVEATRYV